MESTEAHFVCQKSLAGTLRNHNDSLPPKNPWICSTSANMPFMDAAISTLMMCFGYNVMSMNCDRDAFYDLPYGMLGWRTTLWESRYSHLNFYFCLRSRLAGSTQFGQVCREIKEAKRSAIEKYYFVVINILWAI